ncbi:MAG: TOBE domain-containing protein, partial [Rhodospirillaceae bacterium]|nr:TOBE domain-containing protein [Rhodospirillaceae bacterium]
IAELGIAVPASATGCLVVRPEFLRKLGDGERADVRFPATVANDYMLGSRTHYHLDTGKRILVAEVAAGKAAEIAVGAKAEWGFDLSDAALLDE